MKIIRFPDANKTDIIDANEKIIDRIDAWRCNGNPNIEVTLYAYLPPYFFPSRSDGSEGESCSSSTASQVISHPEPVLEVEGLSDFFEDTGGK